jgi:DNA-binding IclR family transcriptional regulator
MSNQGTTLGLVGLAVPVFDTGHKIKGGVALKIPLHRFNPVSKKNFLTILRKTALDIS